MARCSGGASGAIRFRFRNNVQRGLSSVYHRRAHDTDVRLDIVRADISPTDEDLVGSQQGFLPIHLAGSIVGIESVDGVVNCGDENHVVRASANGEVRRPKGRSIDGAIYRARKELSKGCRAYESRS